MVWCVSQAENSVLSLKNELAEQNNEKRQIDHQMKTGQLERQLDQSQVCTARGINSARPVRASGLWCPS